MKPNFEYLLSKYCLRKLVEAKAITYEEYERIDMLNKQRFLSGEEPVKAIQIAH